MTNEELFNDLKQFIDARLSQEMTHVATKEDLAGLATKEELARLATKDDIKGLNTRIDGLETTMNERFDEMMDAEIVKDHERRITRLEHKLA
ncbi:hypothetical protein ABH920_005694 [Catenulispora sp. EB89]|uniref:hypothetical protein n=1 Tax=Catenulispora sp. EB89 TaxID=3156257 RepID=UPI003516764A